MRMTLARSIRSIALLALAGLFAGCSTVEYAHQAWQGQRAVIRDSVPIHAIVEDPAADPHLQDRLTAALQARRFASDALALPDNPSYTRYTALPRTYVVWNLFITPEFSLDAVEHCYLVAGCVAYKGYFEEASAHQEASAWSEQGMDVFVGGVPAYSTLGWYDDPVLSSMMHWDDDYMAKLIFHELAHQQFYIKDDTAFNESFASFVGEQGLREWRASRGLPPPDMTLDRRQQQLTELVLAAREDLAALYASEQNDADKRAAKTERFARLQADYRALRDEQWEGFAGFDQWFGDSLNNAALLPFGLYDQWVPAFARLFQQVGQDWSAFYAAVEQLGQLPEADRTRRLAQLAGR
ncbi:aminopeptidase [Pseudomonas saliphila]|uniref:aminopeptidase n=1 Tax=Pseudomonas saliphila TaxID=2586906 RepID=UPI001239B9E9|nr:aminopeptidase [Pseudomonas saliphila]